MNLPVSPTDPVSAVTRLRIRIDLDEVSNRVWRLVEVPGEATLDQLHAVVQAAMGWENSHMHGFSRGDFWSAGPNDRFVMDIDIADGTPGVGESAVAVADVLTAPGVTLTYMYDFGDDWAHTLSLVEVVEPGPGPARFVLLDGAGACPPEDCGGVGGFAFLLAAAVAQSTAPQSLEEDQREALDWALPDRSPREALMSLLAFDLTHAATRVAGLGAPRPALPAPIAALLERSHDHGPLLELSAIAGFTTPELPTWDLPDAETAARIVAHFAWFIRRVGADGLALTPAGHLHPVDVEALAVQLDLDDEWRGPNKRESVTYPVREFREAAQFLGLVRKLKGRLTVPAKVQRIADDPIALFRAIATRLPGGRGDAARDAGWLLLLTWAGMPGTDLRAGHEGVAEGPGQSRGATNDEEVEEGEEVASEYLCEEALAALGWRSGGDLVRFSEFAIIADPTRTILLRTGGLVGPDDIFAPDILTPDGVLLARAALLVQGSA